MEALHSLFPILVLVMLGIFSRRVGIFNREHVKTLSSFVYYFALPALFYVKLSETDVGALDPDIILSSVVPIMGLILLLYLCKLMGWISKGTFILASLSISMGSYAFFGIAFFENLYDGRWLSNSIIAASALGLVGVFISLTMFEYATKRGRGWGFMFKAVKNPLIISILLGLVSSLLGFQIEPVNSALNLLGKTASGIAIFALGIFLHDNFSLKVARQALGYSMFRIIALPLATYLLTVVGWGGDRDLSRFLLLQSGIPVAISLVVFAERYDYKLAEVTGMVILTSVLSFLVLMILSLLGGVLY